MHWTITSNKQEHQHAWVRVPPTPIEHLKFSQFNFISFLVLSYLPEDTITLILNNFHEASQENDPPAFVYVNFSQQKSSMVFEMADEYIWGRGSVLLQLYRTLSLNKNFSNSFFL